MDTTVSDHVGGTRRCPRRCPRRLKDVDRLVDQLEADNFNRALRINFLEERLLEHERRLAPGALGLVEETQQLREALQARDVELAQIYSKLASLEASSTRQPHAEVDAEARKAETKAHIAVEERAEAVGRARQELLVRCAEKDELRSAARAAEERARSLEETVAAVKKQARSREEAANSRRRADRQERERLEQTLHEQTAAVATLRATADEWRSKYIEAASEAMGLRAAVADNKKGAQGRSDELKHLKIALAKAKSAQRRPMARDEAVRILLEQLSDTRRLIEAARARVSGLDASSHAGSIKAPAVKSAVSPSTLSAAERDMLEIERALTAAV